MRETVPFDKDEIKAYLDRCIVFWRERRQQGDAVAKYYIDTFQSVRTSIFGELLPTDRVEILESIANAARNYHELYEPGPGRNAVANRLAHLIQRLDKAT